MAGASANGGSGGPAPADDTPPDTADTIVSRDLPIRNKKGLHARASARFVEVVGRFDAAVLVERDGEEVSGNDLLGLLMLAASQGTTISVSATGPEAEAVVDALDALTLERFGEGE